MMNMIRDYGNSSNDTGREANLVGHILSRDQLEELEKVAISKANLIQMTKADSKASPATAAFGQTLSAFDDKNTFKAANSKLFNPTSIITLKKQLISNEEERTLLRASLGDQKNLKFLRYFIIPSDDIILNMNELGFNKLALSP
jgi:CCR4-NOT transcriptional regulation complex NOT5 subunit